MVDASTLAVPFPHSVSQGGQRATQDSATVLLGGFRGKGRWYPCWWRMYPCWWRNYPCWREDLGRTNEHGFPGNHGWCLGFLVSSNGGVHVAVSFTVGRARGRGLSSSNLPGFIKLLGSFCLLRIFQIWLIEMRSSNVTKEGTQTGMHTHREGRCHISFPQETKLRSRFNATENSVQVKPQ